jgi:hypothetical protein
VSGDASFEWGEVTDFDNVEFDEREAAFQLNDLELIESGDAS